jgi:23S rRNA C2498 (ribose-2'-O)-methylase RlmM
MTRAQGIDERGNSCSLVTGMAAGDLAEVLVQGGWKYALINDDEGRAAAVVALDPGTLHRSWNAQG